MKPVSTDFAIDAYFKDCLRPNRGLCRVTLTQDASAAQRLATQTTYARYVTGKMGVS